MIPVVAADPRYVAAVAELAPRARIAVAAKGAVVVVGGRDGWWSQARAAIDAGAVGIVVAEPESGGAGGAAGLARTGVPVAVARRRLRSDHLADAGRRAPARLVLADASGTRAGVRSWARDVAGWCRVLADGPLDVQRVARTDGALVCALVADGGAPVSVTLTFGGRGAASACSLIAVAEERTEVHWDEAGGVVEIAHVSHRGRVVVAERSETVERLALRRMLDALDGGALTDLAELRQDDRVAAVIEGRPAP